MARRLPFRPAHLEQLPTLREETRVVAGGPEPDGTAANIFYRVADPAELARLLEENEFNRAGLFTAHHPRAFTDFIEPLDLPPLDAGLQAIIVEGAPSGRARARAGLAALQRQGRAAFGGFFDDDTGLAVVRSPSPDEAIAWLVDAGGWDPARLSACPWSQTLRRGEAPMTEEQQRIRSYLTAQAAKLAPAAIVEKVQAAMAELDAAAAAVPPARFGERPAPEEWSANDVMAHVVAVDAYFGGGILSVLDALPLPPRDEGQRVESAPLRNAPAWSEALGRSRAAAHGPRAAVRYGGKGDREAPSPRSQTPDRGGGPSSAACDP